jgi:organic radical activating enzyme
LKEIIDFVDIISFDLKLKSSTRQGSLWSLHEKFFSVAKTKDIFFKTVITPNTEFRDIKRTAQFMRDKSSYILYLQPDSLRINKSLLKNIFYFQEYLLDKKIDARVLPQIHKFLKIQ